MSNKQVLRILIEIVIGIVVSVIMSVIAISIGYSTFYTDKLTNLDVNFLGMNIFNIKMVGDVAVGTPDTSKMTILGVICSLIIVVVVEFIINFRNNIKKNK